MLSKEQVDFRRLGLGGSDISIILGLSNYKTPYQLYLEKTGQVTPEQTESPQAYWGHKLEPVIRQEFADRHNVTVVERHNLVHPLYDYLRGNLDGYIEEDNSVLEIKTSGAFMAQTWGETGSDVIPMVYLLQVAHYCSLVNSDLAHIAVLIGGNDYREFKYTRNLELEKKIIEAASSFWDCVQQKKPPAASTIEDLNSMFGYKRDTHIQASPKVKYALGRYKKFDGVVKKLEDIKQQYKFEIIEFMKDADCLTDEAGTPLLTYRATKTGSRRFMLKKEKDNG